MFKNHASGEERVGDWKRVLLPKCELFLRLFGKLFYEENFVAA